MRTHGRYRRQQCLALGPGDQVLRGQGLLGGGQLCEVILKEEQRRYQEVGKAPRDRLSGAGCELRRVGI